MLEGEDQTKGKILGNEDCLYLSVYSPSSAAPNNRLPTMEWIHGGAFIFGAGNEYDASVLAQKHGVVVVTLNYRLGPLGFISLPSLKAESPDGARVTTACWTNRRPCAGHRTTSQPSAAIRVTSLCRQRWRKFELGRANVQVFTPSGISESTDFADDHKCAFWSKLQIN
jgi:Carboxylesterase family